MACPFGAGGPSSSGLRVPLAYMFQWPLFPGLTIGGTVVGDPVGDTYYKDGFRKWDQHEVRHGRNIFWGPWSGPNDTGLSRKQLVVFIRAYIPSLMAYANNIIEGTKESLERLRPTYVDVIFAHRCDPTAYASRTFDFVRSRWKKLYGGSIYWGTSEWAVQEIEEAHHIGTKLNLIGPVAEQCQWKYIPPISRLTILESTLKEVADGLQRVTLGFRSTPTALALAWVVKGPNTFTVILGVSSAAQLLQNSKALEVLPEIIMEQVERISDGNLSLR
ncbi:NADP-dependent oxidoreductase domain-containing protein [Mycena rosella]|uniref:NADP-dependent oxidoreductase domain-containing protein n=1 Tax=Mycena rosella TaxID=1033263 RepID=A0AAD7GFD5_MYCRO|nr:NADP-dependent oxidoreductase domain-containing protein [Mycena rosella]